jgi:hypothetical protein
MRNRLFAILGILLLGTAYMAGRLSAPGPNYEPGEIAGDLPLEQAWADFLQSQQKTLELFRSSEFFEDDQERAEAYRAVLYGLVGSIQSGALMQHDHPDNNDYVALPLSPGAMAAGLQAAAVSLFDRSATWLQNAERAWTLMPRNGISKVRPSEGGQVGQYSAFGSWELNNKQAVILSTAASDARYQGIELDKLWFASLDYETRTSSLTLDQMGCAGDGRCYAVISHRDPGVRNWLDTGGHRRGLITMRWQGLDQELPEAQQPRARLVDFDKLSQELPADVPVLPAPGM